LRPRIETERLVLRRFVSKDSEMIYRLNRDPEVMRFMPAAVREQVSPASSARMVEECIAQYERFPGLGIWPTALKETSECIGWTCLKPLDDAEQIELGYRYFPQFWGRGLCTEVSTALVRYGFQELGLDRIVGITDPRNLASRRVLEKLGFRYVKEARYYDHDVLYFVLGAEGETAS